MRRSPTLSLFLLLLVGAAYSSQDQALSAQQIWDKMISAYASCDSYLDEGEVNIVFLQSNGRRTVIKPFSTAFVRPSDFRFEYKDRRGEAEWDRHIIWRDAESVKTWWDIKPGVQNSRNLSFALGAAAGVSNLSSVIVPSLLMPEMKQVGFIRSLSDLKLIGEESINGNSAYKIEAPDPQQNTITLWVDRKSLLILKIYRTAKVNNFETETTTIYKPQINVAIDKEKLAFNAPEKR